MRGRAASSFAAARAHVVGALFAAVSMAAQDAGPCGTTAAAGGHREARAHVALESRDGNEPEPAASLPGAGRDDAPPPAGGDAAPGGAAGAPATVNGSSNATARVPATEEEITVSARAAASETAAVTLLDRDAIERSQVDDAAELLRLASGVHVVSPGSHAGPAHAYTRGGDPNFTLVLLDGIPLNDATDVQGGAFHLGTLRLDGIASVEVLRGPHSWFFGSSAVAGAINLVTRDGRGGPDGGVRLDAGESSIRGAGVVFSGAWREGGGAVDAPGGGVFVGLRADEEEDVVGDDSFRQATAHAASSFAPGVATSLRLVARATDVAAEDYPEGSGGPLFGSGELRSTDARQLSFGLHLAAGGGNWRHGASAVANRAASDVASPAIAPLVPPSLEERTYARAQATWLSSRRVSRAARFSLGAQVDREEGRNQSVLLLPPFAGGEIPGDYALDRTTPGGFAAAELSLGPVVAEVGLRADDPEGLGVEWSPRAGVRWAFRDTGWSLRSGWSRAFKLPSFFALASPPALGGNPDLLPETSSGADLGVELALDGAGVSLAAFDVTYEDLVDFDFATFLHVNRSRVEARGAELAAHCRPASSLRLSTDWTWQEVETVGASQPALNAPEWFGSVTLDWSPSAPLRLRAHGRAAAGSDDLQIPAPDRTRVSGYQVLDLAVSWQVRPAWLVRARVDNAFDSEYEQFVGFPQPGRTTRIGLEYDFR